MRMEDIEKKCTEEKKKKDRRLKEIENIIQNKSVDEKSKNKLGLSWAFFLCY